MDKEKKEGEASWNDARDLDEKNLHKLYESVIEK